MSERPAQHRRHGHCRHHRHGDDHRVVIVASIGLSMGALNQDLYTMIVAMAVVTTMAMPPMLRWALAHLPFAPQEESRLEREAIEARGFVTSMERLLVAVDDSATGSFASRLVGLLASAGSLP